MVNILEQLQLFIELTSEKLQEKENKDTALDLFNSFLEQLESGQIRTARHDENGIWQVDERVKKGILFGFRLGEIVSMGEAKVLPFYDKNTYPVQEFDLERKIRIVPGGTSVRRGAFIGDLVTMMPPSYVNVGAFVDEGTMIDSHALVGSCAQIGKRVHLSAAAQIGGVLEPIGAMPVIVEDDAFIGGNCGIYEGTLISRMAVIAAGVILTSSSQVFDLPNKKIITATSEGRLIIPEGAVVVPGARPAKGEFAISHGLSVATPIIVKYRDDRTDKKATLEQALRG